MPNTDSSWDFHSVVRGEDGNIDVFFSVAPELSYFEGHFPGNPILPGFALIDATVAACAWVARCDVRLLGVPSAKFSKPVSPGERVRIRLRHIAGEEWDSSWHADSVSGPELARLRLRLRTGN